MAVAPLTGPLRGHDPLDAAPPAVSSAAAAPAARAVHGNDLRAVLGEPGPRLAGLERAKPREAGPLDAFPLEVLPVAVLGAVAILAQASRLSR